MLPKLLLYSLTSFPLYIIFNNLILNVIGIANGQDFRIQLIGIGCNLDEELSIISFSLTTLAFQYSLFRTIILFFSIFLCKPLRHNENLISIPGITLSFLLLDLSGVIIYCIQCFFSRT